MKLPATGRGISFCKQKSNSWRVMGNLGATQRLKRVRQTITYKALATAAAALLLASCASAPVYQPAEVEARDVKNPEPISPSQPRVDDLGLETEGLQVEDLNASKARYYQEQAQQRNDNATRIDNALSSAEYFIQAGDYQNAQAVVADLYNAPMNAVQADRLRVVAAYVAYSQNDYRQALNQLSPLIAARRIPSIEEQNQQGVSDKPRRSVQEVDALLLASFAYQALGDYNSAINTLIEREGALVGSARVETTRYIWQVINSLPVEQRQSIIDGSPYQLVRNRVEQSMGNQIGQAALAPQQFGQWRDDANLAGKSALSSSWSANSARSIAVLLPTSSRFNKAAQAVMDGINYQHQQNQSSNRPSLRFYDIGQDPYQAGQYYSAAIQSGADFVIGPLGKDFANQVNSFGGSRIPTLLLGGDSQLLPGMMRFAMGPENEGQRVAERAWRDGHLSAALLVPDNANSRRAVNAFSQRWLSYGGKISKVITYSPKQYDHSVELKQMFDINQSQYRYSQLSRTLGFKPKFSPYQRADIDFIFMIANNKTGRLVRPQINFFSGSKVPVYATSSVFNGIQDSVNNVDLDGTRFPVMPWVLRSSEVAPYAGQLNMLFALGSDAYNIAGSYQTLRRDVNTALNGNTGQISLSANGEAIYQPVWARFRQGEAIAEQTLGIDIAPIRGPNSDRLDNQNVKGNYNDSTWDPRKGQPTNPRNRQRRRNSGG